MADDKLPTVEGEDPWPFDADDPVTADLGAGADLDTAVDTAVDADADTGRGDSPLATAVGATATSAATGVADDEGPARAGTTDAGVNDTGVSDAGVSDTGVSDAERGPGGGRPIRSMPTLIVGLICIAIGVAAGIAELSTLTVGQSASITFLAAAVVILGALIWQSRRR
ncbi:MAG: hypothetical protein AAF962_11810 [Actinomycetota bacterium]